MIRDWYKPLVAAMWLALPFSALRYWRAWDQLPARMAVHFDANFQPNGYTTREEALKMGLGILVAMLALSTVAALAAHALKPAAAWPVLVISYVVIGFIWYGNNSIVDWNLSGHAVHSQLQEQTFPPLRITGVNRNTRVPKQQS
ncbi:MAG TPA: DUF1648 domain-containing protein [Verrucomicrobiae bacterium]|nr:DUF1648 domain-containing protein [Verrucomicrobiae bacterium]